MCRVRANQLIKGLPWGELRKMGFEKVVYTNGYSGDMGTVYEWKLKGEDWKQELSPGPYDTVD